MLHAKEFYGVYRPTVIFLTVKCRWPTSNELGMQKTRRICGNRMEYVGWEDWGGDGWCFELGHSGSKYSCLLVLLVFNLQILLSQHNYKILFYYTVELFPCLCVLRVKLLKWRPSGIKTDFFFVSLSYLLKLLNTDFDKILR